MKKTFLLIATLLMTLAGIAQTHTATDVLGTALKVNKYFMNKYADPTLDTNVGRIRPSSLWTRAVYYEGLMALNEIAPDPSFIEYTDRWANHHK